MNRPREADALHAAAIAVSGVAGDDVFGELARVLGRTLGVDATMIAVFADGERLRMRTLAACLEGRMLSSFEYELARTPCAGVIGRESRYVGSGAAHEFDPDTVFHAKGMDGYAAYSLNGADGAQLGLIAVMSRAPLPQATLVEPLLKIFALRAVAELERTRAQAALAASEASSRASEAQYRDIFNASTDALILWDSSLRRVDVNPAYERIYGWTREEVLGRGYEERRGLPAEYVARRLELVRRSLAGESCRVELDTVRKNGERFTAEVLTIPFQHRGEPHVLTIARDITERKRAEQALRASEEQYRAIYNATADALVLRDSAFRIVDVNAAYEALGGRSRDEVLGLQDLTITRGSSAAIDRRRLHEEALAGKPVFFEADGRRADGAAFVLEVRGVPMAYRGEPHVLYMGRDVTEAKLAERALRASEEQYRAIFNATADALVLRDAEFRIVDVNYAYEAMSGYSRDEVLGRDQLVANPAEMEGETRALHARALAGETVLLETVRVRKDGSRAEIELRGVPILHRGTPHVLYIGRDISERRALESRLRQAQKMEALGQLTGGIAHDFNNLLTSIMGYVVLAAERVGGGDAERAGASTLKLASYLDQALASCRRARDLIAQMLTFSRGQRGARRAQPLAPAVEQSMAMLRGTLPATLELRAALDPAPAALHDPVQLGQVVMNLLINARDAMAGVGRVEVALRSAALPAKAVCTSCRKRFRGRFVELAVSDSGPGVAPPVLERMFEPFFTTKEVGRGSGMGLAMVHGIVHEHGGHVVVESAPGRGSLFRVLLPALSPEAAGAAPAEPPASPGRRTPLRGRVLVVDDEAPVAEFMRELLESWGLAADTAQDPLTVPQRLVRQAAGYDLVIVDYTMPGMNGLRLAQELLAMRPGLPILLYTGHSDAIAADEIAAAGIRALLPKPVEPDPLYDLLKAHLH